MSTSPAWALPLLCSLATAACFTEDENEERIGSDQQASGAKVDEGLWRRWPDGKIPVFVDVTGEFGSTYCGESVDGDEPLGAPFSGEDLVNIDAALERWEKYTPVDFVVSTLNPDGPASLIISLSDNGGHTYEPKEGADPVRLCIVVKSGVSATGVAHELGHAIGLIHEHQRRDRGDYITVDTSCVRPGDLSSYGVEDEGDSLRLGPYDIESIMHYVGKGDAECCDPEEPEDDPNWSCDPTCREDGVCTRPAIRLCDDVENPDCFIPGYKDVSQGDINTVFRMYERALGNDELGDRMGATMVSGDFDDDGYIDLAVGAPDERTDVDGAQTQTGVVFMFRGTSKRLVAWKVLRSRRPTAGGRFGAALAAGDLDGDNRTDLVVGAPGERSRTDAAVNGGNVYLFQAVREDRLDGDVGKSRYFGLGFARLYDAADAGARAEESAEFGAALLIADVTGDGRKDLIIGAPAGALATPPDIFNAIRSGYVAILAGFIPPPAVVSFPPLVPWARILRPGSTPQRTGERFGEALGTFPKGGARWLVVGAPESGLALTRGAAYTFKPQLNSMLPVDELRRGNGATRFGSAIATGKFGPTMNETFVAIGAPRADNQRGRIHVYRVAGTSLGDPTALDLPPSAPPDRMGELLTVVNIGTDLLIAGLPIHDGEATHSGAVRIYVADPSSTLIGGTLTESTAANPAPHDHFGSSVALVGSYFASTGEQNGHELVWGGDGLRSGGGFLVDDRLFHQDSANPQ